VSPASSRAASLQFKAGDKVKVTTNGSSTEATVVSVDEKAGKVTVKMAGQKDEKTVAISTVVKQSRRYRGEGNATTLAFIKVG